MAGAQAYSQRSRLATEFGDLELEQGTFQLVTRSFIHGTSVLIVILN